MYMSVSMSGTDLLINAYLLAWYETLSRMSWKGAVGRDNIRGRSPIQEQTVTDRHSVVGASVVGHTQAIPTVKLNLTLLTKNQGLC